MASPEDVSLAKISTILDKKGKQVHTISPEASLQEAARVMVERNIGSLLVESRSQILGIVTERDYLREVALRGHSPESTQVKDIMSERLICVDPEYTLDECMAIMTEKHIRHLPVIDQGKLIGLVSIGDLVKRVSANQKAHIRYLHDYITNKYPA